MTFRVLLLSKATVCLVFGILLLFVPGWLYDLMGATLGAAGVFAAREYAAAMFGTLMLTWFAQRTQAADARKAILLDLLVYDAIGVVITVLVTLSGVLNALGWGIVAIYLFFTAGSAYLLLKEPAAPAVAT
jgi:hypothetical protein